MFFCNKKAHTSLYEPLTETLEYTFNIPVIKNKSDKNHVHHPQSLTPYRFGVHDCLVKMISGTIMFFCIHKCAEQFGNPAFASARDFSRKWTGRGRYNRKVQGVHMLPRAIFLHQWQAYNNYINMSIRQGNKITSEKCCIEQLKWVLRQLST